MIGIGDVLSIVDRVFPRDQKRLSYEVVDVEESGYGLHSSERPPNSPFNSGHTALMRVTNSGKVALKREDIGKLSIIAEGIEVQGVKHFNKIRQVGVFDVYDIGNIEAKKLDGGEVSISFSVLNPKDSFFIVINYSPVGGGAFFILRGVVADTKIVDGGKRKYRAYKALWEWLCSDPKSLKTFLDDNPEIPAPDLTVL